MKKNRRVYQWAVLGLTLLGLAACQNLPQSVVPAGTEHPTLTSQQFPLMAATASYSWLLGQEEGALFLYDALGSRKIAVGPSETDAVVVGPRLFAGKNVIAVLWQEVRTGADGKREQQVLARLSFDEGQNFQTPVQLAQGENDNIVDIDATIDNNGALWLTLVKVNPQEKVAAVNVMQFTRTATRQSEVLQTNQPENLLGNVQIATADDNVWVAWVASDGSAQNRIRTWQAGDNLVWHELNAVKDTALIRGMDMGRRSSGLVYWWISPSNALEMRELTDDGSVKVIGNTPQNRNTRGMRVVMGPDGTVHAALMQAPEAEQLTVAYYARLPEGSDEMSALQLISGKDYFGIASADKPVLTADASGRNVMAVWTDYRYIYPAVMGALSRDGGASWVSAEPVALNGHPGREVALLPVVAPLGDAFAVAWSKADSLAQKHFVNEAIRVAPAALPQRPVPQPVAERLNQRVQGYWDLRVKGDIVNTWRFFDDYYRLRTDAQNHAESQKAEIITHGYKIVDSKAITPFHYDVTVNFDYEVKPFLLKDGKRAGVPRNQMDTVQSWVWMNGDWHLVYKDIMGSALVKY